MSGAQATRDIRTRAQTESDEVNPKKGLAAWLMNIARETAPLMEDGRTSKQMMDELFDEETGLPK
jgi:hypothetical protein